MFQANHNNRNDKKRPWDAMDTTGEGENERAGPCDRRSQQTPDAAAAPEFPHAQLNEHSANSPASNGNSSNSDNNASSDSSDQGDDNDKSKSQTSSDTSSGNQNPSFMTHLSSLTNSDPDSAQGQTSSSSDSDEGTTSIAVEGFPHPEKPFANEKKKSKKNKNSSLPSELAALAPPPKKPLTAYNKFFQEERKRLIDSKADAVALYMKEVEPVAPDPKQAMVKVIAKRWNTMSMIDRVRYDLQAKTELKEYKQTMEKISQAQKQREAAQKAALASAKKAERAALLNRHHAHRQPPPPQQNGGAAHNPYAGIVGSRISFPSSSWGTTTVASPASASTSQNYQQTSISNSLMTPAMNSTQTSFTKSTLPSNHMLLSVQQFLESQKKGPQQSSWNNNKKILSSNLAAALSINQVVHIFLTDQKRFQEIFQNTVKALGQDSSSAREVNPTNTCPPPSQTTQPPQDLLRSLMGSNSHATQAPTTPEGILAMLQRMQS